MRSPSAGRQDSPRFRWKDRYWRTIRRSVQWILLLLFLVLFLRSPDGDRSGQVFHIPFLLDPLTTLGGLLSSHALVPGAALALATVALTLVFGRVWCGWICPLGTVLDLFPAKRWKHKQPSIPEGTRGVKHFLLLATLFAAALGSLWLLILDPLTILTRTLAEAVWPALDQAVTALETAAYRAPFLRPAVAAVDPILRPALLPAQPVFTAGGALIAALFAALIALNYFAPRFWCRYLCPLGSLLGLLGKFALVRREASAGRCDDCAACARICPTGTIRADKGSVSDPAECTMCLDCVAVCPRSGQSFPARVLPPVWNTYDPGRRQFLAAFGAAIAGTALLRTEQVLRRDPPDLIRPPGARENDLPAKCVRCGECVRACPTGAIHPAVGQAGVGGLWTPVLIARAGNCLYSCNRCGQVCPTEAIPPLTLADKQSRVIGRAYIDKDRCIAWGDHRDCIVCQEMCPLPRKAITLEPVESAGTTVLCPVVDRETCIGCGTCEFKCPVNGEAAIRVFPPGQSIV
jgi:MauM/NapG family ferredoxin protein